MTRRGRADKEFVWLVPASESAWLACQSHEIAELLPQAAQDTAAGLTNRGFGQTQFLCNDGGRQAIDD